MTDRLEEAVAALRGEDDSHESSGDDTLERIRRSLAGSADASTLALEDALADGLGALEAAAGDQMLELAVAALRETEAEVDGAETLARIQRSLASAGTAERAVETDEDRVELAVAAWRGETTGEAREPRPAAAVARDSDAQQPGAQTRVLATREARRARWALAAAAALALVVVPPTAWAWSTGRLERWIESIAAPSEEPIASATSTRRVEPLRPPRSAPPPRAEASVAPAAVREPINDGARDAPEATHRGPSVDDEREPTTTSTPRRPTNDRARPPRRGAAEPSAPSAQRGEPPASTVSPPVTTPPEAADDSRELDARERELFARAHHLHFGGGSLSDALAAWDGYLRAHPRGRYAPEARYNRALTLVRLGRTAEARPVLSRFATAPAGSYRRDEARALLDALDANETAP